MHQSNQSMVSGYRKNRYIILVNFLIYHIPQFSDFVKKYWSNKIATDFISIIYTLKITSKLFVVLLNNILIN